MRLYRLLLRLYPASFRNEYGPELERVFARERRDAGGAAGRVIVWSRAIADTIGSAARVHADIVHQDLRHTARSLGRAPGFAFTAILVTAVGVGATTAVFTVADHVLIRPLPFADPDRVVKIYQSTKAYPKMPVAPANFGDWRAMSTSFAGMASFNDGVAFNLVGAGDPVRLDGAWVTGDLMPMLGVRPLIGRVIEPADDVPGGPEVAVISYQLWQRQFAGDPAIVGRPLNLNGQVFNVAGVMPSSFQFPTRLTELWLPGQMGPQLMEQRDNLMLTVVARLKLGVSRSAAAAEMRSVATTLAAAYPATNANVGAAVIDFREDISAQSRMLLYALLGASGCILLIACTNLASLLVARATARERELAVRAALGAGRERLVRQLMTESLVIAGAGGAIGVSLAIAAVPLIVKLVPTGLPVAELPGVNVRMLLIAAAVTLATGIAFGVFPALGASRRRGRANGAAALRDGARAGTSRRAERLRGGLVIAQVAASVVLLIGAGLLIRALWRIEGINLGIRPDSVLTMRTTLPTPQYSTFAARAAFYDRVIGGVRALPGVESAAYTSWLPMTFRGGIWPVFMPGQSRENSSAPTVSIRYVTDDLFKALGVPIVTGRAFDQRDSAGGEKTVIVSESFARRHWPGEDARGKHFFVAFFDRVVIGVAGDVRVRGPERDSEPQVYFSYRQQPDNLLTFYSPKDLVVKLSDPDRRGGFAEIAAGVRRIVAKADPELPVSDVRPLSAIVAGEAAARVTQVRVLGAFAAVACLLAVIGLHGLLAYVVSSRSREIGVRLALGAEPRQIMRLVTTRGAALGIAGAIVGAGVAYLAARSMQSILAGVNPGDVMTFGVAFAIAVAGAVIGSWLPARRASRTDPTTALRAD